ncbi:hypothetical protein A3G56_00360 [Candidatus Falkowbacteria bacterium RIFCSPLOWO2_12_FULL_45_10]|uniref:L,D-TPase catalytic domain-containing protein n=1 Tax=Candidatus Falkowbacteria bacterium RIFCSPLOWO2_12_FULL_45_10 TaxID=1797990 RepID=A0A1F5RZ13_9BACT|nr:MAG: hypothetical protein A3G56_00360 [Candidatus Falkowbacteria bacterium RIFCSPLOWO2_12_FULL_45_10]
MVEWELRIMNYELGISKIKYVIVSIGFIFSANVALAQQPVDTDGDRVPNYDEINIYHTNPDNPDTDGDGYGDWEELNNGYSPYAAGEAKLENNDADSDGLSDKLELAFHTDPTNPDTDGDGFIDGDEVNNGYDPAKPGKAKLEKKIFIDTKNQLLAYNLGEVRLGLFPISTGKRGTETPAGQYQVIEKNPRRWSSLAKLWMPYWLMFDRRGFGVHELPEWNDGTKEGADHLGIPVSHGCVRLGVGPAERLYNWAEIGTKVFVN